MEIGKTIGLHIFLKVCVIWSEKLVVKWKGLKGFLFMMLGTFLDGEKVLSDNPNVVQYRPDNDNPDKQPYTKQKPVYIEIPVVLEGREIARVSHQYITEYQNRAQERNSVF